MRGVPCGRRSRNVACALLLPTFAAMSESSDPQLGRIVETALYVDDLARSRAFYVDILGCEPLLDSGRLLALSVAGASVLLLFQRGATSTPLPPPRGAVARPGAPGRPHHALARHAHPL